MRSNAFDAVWSQPLTHTHTREQRKKSETHDHVEISWPSLSRRRCQSPECTHASLAHSMQPGLIAVELSRRCVSRWRESIDSPRSVPVALSPAIAVYARSVEPHARLYLYLLYERVRPYVGLLSNGAMTSLSLTLFGLGHQRTTLGVAATNTSLTISTKYTTLSFRLAFNKHGVPSVDRDWCQAACVSSCWNAKIEGERKNRGRLRIVQDLITNQCVFPFLIPKRKS